jgi:hypothetical protein
MKGDFSRSTFRSDNHYSHVLIEQGRVQVDADWNEQQEILHHRLNTEAIEMIGQSGTSIKNNGFLISLSADGKSLTIGKGRFFVDGILCENEADVPFLSQPDLPKVPDPFQTVTGAQKTAGILYLDVWRRHLTALDDAHIREVALDGAETSTRARTVWQVKVLPINAPAAGLNAGSDVPEWDALIAGSTGTMNARTQPTLSTDNPCLIPPTAGYQSVENQLYRVEIHQAGQPGTASFKWSRDNGSVETRILSINANQVTVHDLGPDQVLGFAGGQTVELLTDHHDLFGLPGQLLTIDSVTTAANIVTLKSAPNIADLDMTLHPRMRRWDSQGALTVPVPPAGGTWIPLENGVQVQFSAGFYATGDYWLIPARTVTGEIDWPPFAIPNLAPIAQSPAGIRHHYCRLALLQLVNATAQLQDWRSAFPSLTDIPSPDDGIHVTGLLLVDRTTGNTSVLVNDTNVQVSSFGGIDVQCDLDVDPASISRPTCYVSVEDSFQFAQSGPAAGYRATNLAGTVKPGPKTISWRPTADAVTLLNQMIPGVPPGDRGILARLTLKGNFIWALQNRNLFLDGETFAEFHDGATNIFLKFPSGDKRRGGDFEMWFWLVAAPATLSSIQVPAQLLAGATAAVTITLTDNAPAGGLPVTVTIASTPANLVTSPATPTTITVPAGTPQTSFNIQIAPGSVGQATITASVPGVSKAGTLSVAPLTLTGNLDIVPRTINVGDQATGTVHLTAPAPLAPAPPTVVTLVSANTGVATVPANVTVPGGATSAQFFINGINAGTTSLTTTITATLGITLQNTVTVKRKTGKEGVVKESAIKEVATKELVFETVPRLTTRPQDISTGEPGPSAGGHAFIRPEERPPV